MTHITIERAKLEQVLEALQESWHLAPPVQTVVGNTAKIDQKTAETHMDTGFDGGGQQVPAAQPTIDKSEGICNECETVAHCMKNGCIPKRPVQEPVAWQAEHQSGEWHNRTAATLPSTGIYTGRIRPLYPPAAQYPLPDDLYDSKDWRAADYAGRVEFLHSMYEARKLELDAYLDAAQPAPTGQAPCARHCEATAFKIMIRNLNGDIGRLKAQLSQAQPAPAGISPLTYCQECMRPNPTNGTKCAHSITKGISK